MTAAPLAGDGAWKHAGEKLQARRVQLDRRWRNRTLFAAESGLNYKMVQDIETAARTNFPVPTLADIELAYCLMTGNIRRMVSGAALEPDPVAERRLRLRQNLRIIGGDGGQQASEGDGQGA